MKRFTKRFLLCCVGGGMIGTVCGFLLPLPYAWLIDIPLAGTLGVFSGDIVDWWEGKV